MPETGDPSDALWLKHGFTDGDAQFWESQQLTLPEAFIVAHDGISPELWEQEVKPRGGMKAVVACHKTLYGWNDIEVPTYRDLQEHYPWLPPAPDGLDDDDRIDADDFPEFRDIFWDPSWSTDWIRAWFDANPRWRHDFYMCVTAMQDCGLATGELYPYEEIREVFMEFNDGDDYGNEPL